MGGRERAREREERETKREKIANGERTEDAGCRETVRRSIRDRSGGECPLFLLGMLRCFSSPEKRRSISLFRLYLDDTRYFHLFFLINPVLINSFHKKTARAEKNVIICARIRINFMKLVGLYRNREAPTYIKYTSTFLINK